MQKIALAFLLIWCLSSRTLANDYYWAIQPGIRLGWQAGSGMTISAQISFEILSQSASFIDFTFGSKQSLYRKTKHPYDSHLYLDLELGKYYETNPLAFTKGGLGIIFYHNESNRRIRPRGTISSGYISLFRNSVPILIAASIDLTAIRLKKILWDAGTRLTLWLPARSIPSY